jgi:undecaprenyl-diphosphatase
MLEQLVLGAIQGITEWLPVSSKAFIILARVNIFGSTESLGELIREALFLHIGTFFSALVYFWKDVVAVFKKIIDKPQTIFDKKGSLAAFLFLTTLISGTLGFLLLTIADTVTAEAVESTGKAVTFLIGILLVGTGILQLSAKNVGTRTEKDIARKDGIILGLVQALAALPGFSRSGLTVSALLLRKFNKVEALRLSFLMSLPIIFVGNILLNFSEIIHINLEHFVGLATAFVIGLATIKGLLLFAQKVNFGYFVIGFGVLTILLAIITL